MGNFAPQAQADLDQAVGWLFDQGTSASVGEALLTAVLEAADLLARRSQLGRVRLDLLPAMFRFWSIPKHDLLLVYDPAASVPITLRVVSTDRDFGPILAGLRGLED